jgi:type I restriction enzyme S subunit
MQNLSYGDFLSVWISVPTMSEQMEIAARLDRATAGLNRAIETAQTAIGLARERRAALISAAVTGKIHVGVGA